MKKTFSCVCFILLSLLFLAHLAAASGNFLAQGYYYEAKDQYKNGHYEKALSYANKSREALQGTNDELQYLIIKILVGSNRLIEAEEAIKEFAKLDSRDPSLTRVNFDDSVEKLTSDEKRDVAKLMIRTLEGSQEQKKQAAERELAKEFQRAFSSSGMDTLLYPQQRQSHGKTASFDGEFQVTVSDSGIVTMKITEEYYFDDDYPDRDLGETVLQFRISEITHLTLRPKGSEMEEILIGPAGYYVQASEPYVADIDIQSNQTFTYSHSSIDDKHHGSSSAPLNHVILPVQRTYAEDSDWRQSFIEKLNTMLTI
ncbi:MAG: hypothetical protein C0620_01090 [Desulfuromonas sp.]|nr:MAG: hypothetical protein C0620_01090 [Desulfuromonas sp.]